MWDVRKLAWVNLIAHWEGRKFSVLEVCPPSQFEVDHMGKPDPTKARAEWTQLKPFQNEFSNEVTTFTVDAKLGT